jgi:hypothetical protein
MGACIGLDAQHLGMRIGDELPARVSITSHILPYNSDLRMGRPCNDAGAQLPTGSKIALPRLILARTRPMQLLAQRYRH